MISGPERTDVEERREDLRAFVVSLARCPERRRKTVAAFAAVGIRLEVVEAVDGTGKIAFEDGESVDFVHSGSRPCVFVGPAQAGCYLSHYRLLRRAYEEGLERVLVFEDDARPLPGLQAALDELAALPASFELVRLYCPPQRRAVPGCIPLGPVGRVAHHLRDGRRIIRLRGRLYETVAYTMSRTGMRKFLDRAQPICAPLDVLWAYFWRLDLASYVVSESLAVPSGETTTMVYSRRGRAKAPFLHRKARQVAALWRATWWHLRDWFAYHVYIFRRRGEFYD